MEIELIAIRKELPGDRDFIYGVNRAAFGGDEEARLVDALRKAAAPFLSFVAVEGERIIGHVAYSPVEIDGRHQGQALAPMAVLPECQGLGAGSLLVRESLQELASSGYPWVVVLGHPEYYPRFGFCPAFERGIHCEYDAPEEAFMVVELSPGALKGVKGTARYHPAFASV